MMDAIADAIVARLKARFQGWKVDRFPDVPARYPFLSAQRELLVSYEESNYGEPESIWPASVPRTASFAVTILVRSLKGPNGAAATIDDVRKALFGWQAPQGGTPFVPTRDRFVSEDEGVWRFVVSFRTVIPTVAEVAELDGPPLTGVETESETIGGEAA